MSTRADLVNISGPILETGEYILTVTEGNPDIFVSMDSYEIMANGTPGESYQILGDEGDGWLEIQVGDKKGYISSGSGVSIKEKDDSGDSGSGDSEIQDSKNEDLESGESQESSDARRKNLVDYAFQFLGCRYRDAGSDPSGFDCSGFVRYVMQNGAGVALNRSSSSQATQGVSISQDQMRPGDLIFYGKGGRINHVAMYAGNGQVVHASTYKTGVKLSTWNYRPIMKIVNVLGD